MARRRRTLLSLLLPSRKPLASHVLVTIWCYFSDHHLFFEESDLMVGDLARVAFASISIRRSFCLARSSFTVGLPVPSSVGRGVCGSKTRSPKMGKHLSLVLCESSHIRWFCFSGMASVSGWLSPRSNLFSASKRSSTSTCLLRQEKSQPPFCIGRPDLLRESVSPFRRLSSLPARTLSSPLPGPLMCWVLSVRSCIFLRWGILPARPMSPELTEAPQVGDLFHSDR